MVKKKLPNANRTRGGSLSLEEKKFIEQMVQTDLSDLDIAQKLNRTVKQITKYKMQFLANAPKIIAGRNETAEYKRELRAAANWSSLKDQFTEKEMVFYENSYVEYRRQLKDISTTERTQLHHLISLDVMMNRIQIDRKKAQEEIERIEKFLENEHKKDFSSLKNDEKNYLTHCETQLASHKMLVSQKGKEFKDLLEKHKDILVSLKSTRDQRIKSLEDRGKFISLLHELELSDRRKDIGQITALHQMAMEKEKERLSQAYQYDDGTIDQPLLNAETNIEDYD